jgi:hypothetical protein
MIYRVLLDTGDLVDWGNEERAISISRGVAPPRIMRGISYYVGELLDENGIKSPDISNRRARFYLTQAGWDKIGRRLAAEAKRHGRSVKVIRRKDPKESQVVYRDELQIAVLPARVEKRLSSKLKGRGGPRSAAEGAK